MLHSMLHRNLLARHLHAFFQRAPVAHAESKINPRTLLSKAHWYTRLAQLHDTLGNEFLTPCELVPQLLAPIISRALWSAHHRQHECGSYGSTQVVEVGAGTAAIARIACANTNWSIIELSTSLAQAQRDVLPAHIPIVVGDATQKDVWLQLDGHTPRNQASITIVCNEVLDNLPHDKVVFSLQQQQWLQARVCKSTFSEHLEPLDDPDIADTLDAFLASRRFSTLPAKLARCLYLPTGLLQLLRSARSSIASSTREIAFFALDFAHVPDRKLRGINAPAVAAQVGGGKTLEYSSYTRRDLSYGDVDIIFPTDFAMLSTLCARELGTQRGTTEVLSLADFAQKHAQDHIDNTRAANGFHPLLHDFHNYSVLHATP